MLIYNFNPLVRKTLCILNYNRINIFQNLINIDFIIRYNKQNSQMTTSFINIQKNVHITSYFRGIFLTIHRINISNLLQHHKGIIKMPGLHRQNSSPLPCSLKNIVVDIPDRQTPLNSPNLGQCSLESLPIERSSGQHLSQKGIPSNLLTFHNQFVTHPKTPSSSTVITKEFHFLIILPYIDHMPNRTPTQDNTGTKT